MVNLTESIYHSEEQTRKLVKAEAKETGTGTIFNYNYDKPINHDIIDWLEKNHIAMLIGAMPGQSHSDENYLFQGNDKILYVIHPKVEYIKGMPAGLNPRDQTYKWILRIRYQSDNQQVSKELSDILNEKGFSIVESN